MSSIHKAYYLTPLLEKVRVEQMGVKTKSIFEPAERDDGYRILITRYYPRGVSKGHIDEWTTTLAPNPELLFAFKDGKIDWETFKREFIAQLKADEGCQEAILTLNELSKSEDITLLCFEKSGNPCHRHLVRALVEDPHLLSKAELTR